MCHSKDERRLARIRQHLPTPTSPTIDIFIVAILFATLEERGTRNEKHLIPFLCVNLTYLPPTSNQLRWHS